MTKPLLKVNNLKVHFSVKKQILKAVDGVSFSIYPGETLGLVGESGSGKSTTGRALLGLEKQIEGEICFEGKSLQDFSRKELKHFRQTAQMIFQDPYASLNPRMLACDIIAEPLDIHQLAKGAKRLEKVEELLHLVGLPTSSMNRFPHEFSGGQRQRIGIARALAAGPRFLVCDEPISALDVSIQAQIVNLLKKLQKEMNLTFLFIAHDLSMVKYLSDRVAVMYLGQIVELAPSETLYQSPHHPYTQALLSAIPIPDPVMQQKRARLILKGELPSPLNPPQGCAFASRCPHATERCKQERPKIKEIEPNHFVACHLLDS